MSLDTKDFDWRFEALWTDYPLKRDKALARRAFNSIPNMTEQLFASMLDAIKEQKQSEEWRKDNGKFIPQLHKWLNNERWHDELNKTPLKLANSPLQRQLVIGGYDSVEAWQRAYTGNLVELLAQIREHPEKYRLFIESNAKFMSKDLGALLLEALQPANNIEDLSERPW